MNNKEISKYLAASIFKFFLFAPLQNKLGQLAISLTLQTVLIMFMSTPTFFYVLNTRKNQLTRKKIRRNGFWILWSIWKTKFIFL